MKKMFFLMLLITIQSAAMNEQKKPVPSDRQTNNGNKKKRSPRFNFKTQVPKATTFAHAAAAARSLSPNSKAELVKTLSGDLNLIAHKQPLPATTLVTLLDAEKNITTITHDQCKQHLNAEILVSKQQGNLKKPTPPRERTTDNRTERRNGTLSLQYPVIPPTPTDAATNGTNEAETPRLSFQITSAPTTPGSATNGNHNDTHEYLRGYELVALATTALEQRANKPHVHHPHRNSYYASSPSVTPRAHRPSISVTSTNSSHHNARHSRSYSADALPTEFSMQNTAHDTLDISANWINSASVSDGV